MNRRKKNATCVDGYPRSSISSFHRRKGGEIEFRDGRLVLRLRLAFWGGPCLLSRLSWIAKLVGFGSDIIALFIAMMCVMELDCYLGRR
jgi:hypothetical protein